MSFEELAFLPEEIQELFQQNNGLALSRQDAEMLVQQTEGWIAAIHLTNGRPGSMPRMHPLESTRELFDFFSREILDRQPDHVRRFLLMTSLFDTFDVGLCERVLGPVLEGGKLDWITLFDVVRSGNLFSVPLDAEGRWMRYHHLFRHFLKSQLLFEQPALAWFIQSNLALAYEADQAWEEALAVYANMDDYENQVRLLKQTGADFISAGRVLSLAAWLEKLPDAVIHSQPVLISLQGIIHTSRGDNRRALEMLNLAEVMLGRDGDRQDWVRTLSRRAEVQRQLGMFDQAMQDAERILEISGEAELPALQFDHAEAQRIKGLVLVDMGDLGNALEWLERSLQSCRAAGLWKNIPILETELGVIHRRLGNLGLTAQYYSSALKAMENAGNTAWKARLLNNMGLLNHVTGRLEEALAVFDEAVRVAELCGYNRIKANVLIGLGDLHTDLSNHETAYEYYDRALTLATNLGHSPYIFYSSYGCARLQRLNGDPQLAVEELRQAELSQVDLGILERGLIDLELGRCWLETGRIDQALVVLGEAVESFEKAGDRMAQSIAGLWLACASVLRSPPAAVQALKEILPPSREWQKPTPFMLQARQIFHWLKKQGNHELFQEPLPGKFFEQAEQVFGAVSDLVHPSNRRMDGMPEIPQLEIVSFGEVQVRRNGRLLASSDWQTREARDLFFFLLQSPPLTKEQIALEFWPDISPARLKMRFKINIYRIRQAVGQDVILYENERYGFNRSVNYAWDREILDRLLGDSLEADNEKKIPLLEEAQQHLNGLYLADLDAEWAVADRLRYQEKKQDLLLELAGLYLQLDRPRDCLKTAKLALDADPLLEAAHRLMIQAYATLHDPIGMTLQYRKYQQILQVELGLEPSSEINALYERLLDTI
ncbi:MAG: tetratricopeptide repeat protein [Anaerolineae bacterium]|nr:tetratricopeptide repeat protein [Anaerolineae bacterium]